ncbi:MAG: hypothetical protein ACI9LV_000121 [Candidatus Nanohaloarchaea archaeon]|jgi:hypothetical protein
MSTEDAGYRLDKGMPVFADIDKTLLKGDTGKEWLVQAGVVSPEEFPEFVQEYRRDDLGHSNELVKYLSEQDPETVENLEEHVEAVRLPERAGLGEVLSHRHDEDVPTIGASAGYRPVIQSATNGNLHDIIAGDLDENYNPVFNGQNEKRENVEQYLERLVEETKWWAETDLPYTAIGDSNGDIEKLRGASESGGYAIAIGSSIEEARERVDEATFYVGDEEDHYLTAALLNDLTLNEEYQMSSEELLEKSSTKMDETMGIEPGELADKQDRRELNEFMRQLNYD